VSRVEGGFEPRSLGLKVRFRLGLAHSGLSLQGVLHFSFVKYTIMILLSRKGEAFFSTGLQTQL
jgi:hypothetical protein